MNFTKNAPDKPERLGQAKNIYRRGWLDTMTASVACGSSRWSEVGWDGGVMGTGTSWGVIFLCCWVLRKAATTRTTRQRKSSENGKTKRNSCRFMVHLPWKDLRSFSVTGERGRKEGGELVKSKIAYWPIILYFWCYFDKIMVCYFDTVLLTERRDHERSNHSGSFVGSSRTSFV